MRFLKRKMSASLTGSVYPAVYLLQLLPEDFPEAWEYYFEIFFSGDWIELTDKQHIVFWSYISVWQITDLSQSYDTTHVQT